MLNAVGVGHASLDRAFHIAMDNGLMCKTTGAGGGGCALVLVPPGELEWEWLKWVWLYFNECVANWLSPWLLLL